MELTNDVTARRLCSPGRKMQLEAWPFNVRDPRGLSGYCNCGFPESAFKPQKWTACVERRIQPQKHKPELFA
jgi:hypothetical protein